MLPRFSCGLQFTHAVLELIIRPLSSGVPRSLHVQPVGLQNLGATCYLNTILQALFHCLPFRAAVYRFTPPESDASQARSGRGAIIMELQSLFGRLELGAAAVADCSGLVSLLQLDRGYQQDPVEFWKMLGASLEESFKFSRDPSLVNVFNEVPAHTIDTKLKWTPDNNLHLRCSARTRKKKTHNP